METNESSRLLHHNKFVIFNNEDGTGAVHTGAGNFTHAAFSKNFENYYFITIPNIVHKFNEQYEHMYINLASDYNKLPASYVKP
jgi:phosphatidylserine/phosphatidylglycerophosphate/cardiolipin synthase-like enzyme